jgi:hypothetical protein
MPPEGTPLPRPPLDGEAAPWGHSTAAHRAHGFCSDCHDRSTFDELVAWRVRENRRHEAEQAARAASEADRRGAVDLQLTRDHLCPACGAEALAVVTATLTADSGERRPAGGWAHCLACDATPHPTLEVPDRG